MAYVESFDFVTLTETVTEENVDLPHVFTDYVKLLFPAIKPSHQDKRTGGNLVIMHKSMSVWFCSK